MSSAREALTDRLTLWQVCALAFVAMVAVDLLSTAMVIFEAHYQALSAGICDALSDIARLAGVAVSVDAVLNGEGGWRSKRSICVIAATAAASLTATYAGVLLARAIGA